MEPMGRDKLRKFIGFRGDGGLGSAAFRCLSDSALDARISGLDNPGECRV